MTTFARHLRQERKRRRLTQAELANQLHVSQATISRWEQGTQDPDFDSLLKLSKSLDVDPMEWSFAGEREEHPFAARIMLAQEVRVVGGIHEDLWVESSEWESSDQFDLQIPPLKGWDNFKIEGYVIQDDSSLPAFAKDSIVFCASVDLIHEPIQKEELLVIARQSEFGLYEVSMREVHFTKDGHVLLANVSRGVNLQNTFQLVENAAVDTGIWLPKVTVADVRGVVVSSYRPEIGGRRRAKKA